MRDAMLAAVPSLRAFAISLSGNVDRADDHRAIQHVDRIAAVPVLGGLHRHLLQDLIFGTDNPTNHALLR